MTYTKPELVALTQAVEAIQSSGKNGNPPEVDDQLKKSSPAYEADE